MRFDGFDTIEGRHLVFAYAAVFLIQGGYFAWIVLHWLRLDPPTHVQRLAGMADTQKARKPTV